MEEGDAEVKLCSENGNESSVGRSKEKDGDVLKFMDSMDDYLTLMDALCATLRQGWLDLASARYSMGGSRINSKLFDLKYHDASTTLMMGHQQGAQFSLCKWASPRACCSAETKLACNDISQERNDTTSLQSSGTSLQHDQEDRPNEYPHTTDELVQKERSKSLSVFGTLVSPKLREAQLSFETALDTLVAIANARSSMLSAYDRVCDCEDMNNGTAKD